MSAQPFDISSIPASKRWSFVFVERGYLELDENAVVLRAGPDSLLQIPVGMFTCLMIGPGVVVTHEAVKACAIEQTLLIWVGENGVRCYSAGMPGGACGTRILHQAALALDSSKRLTVARALYGLMFKEEPPAGRSIDQMRGIEGSRVKKIYQDLALKYRVKWDGRDYDIKNFNASDDINRAISAATTTLYGITESVILALGFTPAIGFIHSGDARSFVFDVADTIKYETVLPVAFKVAGLRPDNIESQVRHACRDLFRELGIAERLVTIIETVLQCPSS